MNAPDNCTRIFYDYTAPTRYSHSSHLALMDKPRILRFLTAFALYSPLSTLLGHVSRLSPIVLTFVSVSRTLAVLVAVAPLSALESDAKLILFFWNAKIYIKIYS